MASQVRDCGFLIIEWSRRRFDTLKKFREPRKQCVTHGHVSIKANISGSMLYNMFKRIGIRLASLKVDEILSMGAKETPNVEIPKTNGSILT